MSVYEDHWRWMLEQRGIETACPVCQGVGSRRYPSTSTWRGGMGGASITSDVCDKCWGSGDVARPWTDLRRLRNTERERIHLGAAALLAERCGVGLRTLLPGLDELVSELRKFERGRKARPYGFDTVARCLANTLADMVKAKRDAMAADAPTDLSRALDSSPATNKEKP